jgi:hypothetical protein
MHFVNSPLACIGPTSPRHSSRKHALSLCLSAALASPLTASQAVASPAASTNWIVKNCNDSGADSLRDIIENPLNAKSGDSVDLSQLPTLCGMQDSKITLGSEIVALQDTLYLYGPLNGNVTISGAGLSRVFHHKGAGTLALNALIVADGYYHSPGGAYGGCIGSDGSVSLNHVVVRHCTATSDNWIAAGGGISTAANISLIASRVSENEATGGYFSMGGGVYSVGGTTALYSSISANTAKDGVYVGEGGAAFTHTATLVASTIDNNESGIGGGVVTLGPTAILNSTISRNSAQLVGGIYAWQSSTLLVANSTIAFNHQSAAGNTSAGIYFFGAQSNGTLTLQSSIIARNTAGAADAPADVYLRPGSGMLGGTDNLVLASNVLDPAVITVTTDPKLGELQFNGGPTKTHRLLPGSPALGKGNTDGMFPTITNDQRGPGYPRTSGASASVDMGAVQFDLIFADGFNSPF